MFISPKFNTAFSNIYSIKNEDIDLLSDLKIDEKNYSTNSLISYVIREDTYSKIIVLFLSLGHANNNKTYTDNYNFLESHRRKFFKNIKLKKTKYYDKKIFIFPYYSNQFGHFIGENLGGILFFLDLLKKEKKGKIINCNTKQKLKNIS